MKLVIGQSPYHDQLLDSVSLDPNPEATSEAFDAIASWVENNFPQWGIENIIPDYKVEQ